MAVRFEGDLDFVKDFEKEVMTARRKAGRKFGAIIVSERKRQLGSASARRKKAVKALIGRDGTLVAADFAPLARAQETGETIKAKGSRKLLVRIGPYPKPGEKTFSTKQGFVFGEGKRLIGVLKSSVVIPRASSVKRLSTIVDRVLPDYLEEIDKNLFEGVR